MLLSQQYDILLESLQLVAAPFSEQSKALPEFVEKTDEVANSFGDAFLLVPQLRRAGLVSEEAYIYLKKLDEWFGTMPQDGTVFEEKSLENSQFWNKARLIARRAIDALNEKRFPPNQNHVFWTK